MKRRYVLTGAVPWALAAGAALTACQGAGGASASGSTGGSAGSGTAAGQKQDLKSIAADLQAKNQALIDAMNAKNDAGISRAKSDLQKQADQAEDVVSRQTGPTANQINSAINNIRTGVLSNDVSRLERAKTLLQQASQ